MKTSDKVKALLILNGKMVMDLAVYFGMSRQSMNNKMLRDSWSIKDLKKVADFVGCDLLFEMGNGERIYLHSREA